MKVTQKSELDLSLLLEDFLKVSSKLRDLDEATREVFLDICSKEKGSLPFFKLSDMCSDAKIKTKIFEQSFDVEPNDASCIKLISLCLAADDLSGAKLWHERLKEINPDNQYLQYYSFVDSIYFNGSDFSSRLLPSGFDARFYFESHKDVKANSKLEAICHYLNWGHKELRDYLRPIEIPFVDRSNEELVLFTQYYPCDEITRSNITSCLENNIENEYIDKIVIFYDDHKVEEELSSLVRDKKKVKIEKIHKRLTYKAWFDYSLNNYPKSIKVLANSDIGFDETVDSFRRLDYRKDIFYSCSRLDLTEDGHLVESKIDGSPNSPLINKLVSQDCWAFKNRINEFKSDFVLGYENCDVLLKHNCLMSGCHFLNLFDHIRCIHLDPREAKVRKRYSLETGRVEGEPEQEASLQEPNILFFDFGLPWQTPASTEKQAFVNHENNRTNSQDMYLGCPWASVIDYILVNFSGLELKDFYDSSSVRGYLESQVDNTLKNYIRSSATHTVCQHIHWSKLIRFWEWLGIKHLHVSHLTSSKPSTNIALHPWHLIAANTENPKRKEGLLVKSNLSKKYLCSFVGSYTKDHRSKIRLDLSRVFAETNKKHIKKESFFLLKDQWFYYDLVYGEQISGVAMDQDKLKKQELDTKVYNSILSDSIFSICPEGSGPNTIRLWESMSVGSIPVLFENDWERPEIKGFPWNSFSLTIKKDDINELLYILNNFSDSDIDEMKVNCINAYNVSRSNTCL